MDIDPSRRTNSHEKNFSSLAKFWASQHRSAFIALTVPCPRANIKIERGGVPKNGLCRSRVFIFFRSSERILDRSSCCPSLPGLGPPPGCRLDLCRFTSAKIFAAELLPVLLPAAGSCAPLLSLCSSADQLRRCLPACALIFSLRLLPVDVA